MTAQLRAPQSNCDVIPDGANGLRERAPDDRLRGDPESQDSLMRNCASEVWC